MIDKITEQKIKDAADIVDIVSEFVQLEKKGFDYVGLCPFHDDHSPSLHVSQSKGRYKCYACGEGGDTVSFVMKKLSKTYPETLKWLADRYHIDIPQSWMPREEWIKKKDMEAMYAVNKMAMDYYASSLMSDNKAKAYFADRGVKQDTIEKYHLGYAPANTEIIDVIKQSGNNMKFLLSSESDVTFKSGKNLHVVNGTGIVYQHECRFHDRFASRVIFPWMNITGQVIAFGGRKLDVATHGVEQKYVNSPDSIIFHKDHELYGMYQAKEAVIKKNKAYIVEGYLDAILMNQVGLANVVANSGTALSTYQIALLKKYTKNITLIYDSDEPGIKAALRSLSMFLKNNCNVDVLLLPNEEDPASFILSHSEPEINQYFADHTKDFVLFMCDVLLSDDMSVADKANAIERILIDISNVKDDIKRELYFKELVSAAEMEETVLRKVFNKLCGIEAKTPTSNEHNEECATTRKPHNTTERSKAQNAGNDYTMIQSAFDGLSLYDKENFINENEEELKSLLVDGAPVFDEDGEDTEEILLELIVRGMSEADILNQVVDDIDEVRDALEDISDTDYYELNEEDC